METLLFDKTNEQIDYHSRTSTQGEELKMVRGFISSYLKKNRKNNVAIFIEPQLPSGYPDIVIAEYSSMQKLTYNEYRCKLNSVDLKILFHILQFNSISKKSIENALGYTMQDIERSISVLKKSEMIYVSSTGNFIRKHNIKSFFKIKRIISVEAKIGKWHNVIDQSYTNQWFSSQSYILINKFPSSQCKNICQKEGVGIIFVNNGDYQQLTESIDRKLPVSFMSIQFNEWIYRNEKGAQNE